MNHFRQLILATLMAINMLFVGCSCEDYNLDLPVEVEILASQEVATTSDILVLEGSVTAPSINRRNDEIDGLSYVWTVSPVGPEFTSPELRTTSVTFSTPDMYTFTLTVTDSNYQVTATERRDHDVIATKVIIIERADESVLTYLADPGGRILGEINQVVTDGDVGSEVTAVSYMGYEFVGWSDGRMDASRTDTATVSDLTLTAKFEEIDLSGIPVPSLSLDGAAEGVTSTNNSNLTITVIFSEEVSGFDNIDGDDISASGDAVVSVPISNPFGSHDRYQFELTVHSQGEYTITIPAGAATAYDDNDESSEGTLTLTYDITPPAAPTINEEYSDGEVTGISAEDVVRVEVLQGGVLLGNAEIINESGNWEYPLSEAGNYNLTAITYDTAGNSSELSAAVTISVP